LKSTYYGNAVLKVNNGLAELQDSETETTNPTYSENDYREANPMSRQYSPINYKKYNITTVEDNDISYRYLNF